MVRQRARNTLEEVYGTKFDAAKSQANNNNKNIKDRGYIITSNMPYSTTLPPTTSMTNCGMSPAAINTSRRKSARPNMKTGAATAHKYPVKEEKDDGKKEHNAKLKTSRGGNEKWQYNSSASHQYDNKTFRAHNEPRKDMQARGDGNGPQQHQNYSHPHPHPHPHQHDNQNLNHNHNHNHNHKNRHQHDDDKDDDTEEFFELIRQTVEGAIGKSVSELLNRNFRELGAKVDRFSLELKNTNEMLNKIQMDFNNKIVHYGEENSRHFRYLCMKSEYDKMFYQHQTMMTSAPVLSSDTSQTLERKSSAPSTNTPPQPQQQHKEVADDSSLAPCTCRSTTNPPPTPKSKDSQKSSSDEHNVSQKSSEVGMREVLDHIQRFCTQMQMSEKKSDRPSGSKSNNNNNSNKNNNSNNKGAAAEGLGLVRLLDSYMHDNGININPQMFAAMNDDDDLGLTSDGMTPRSDEDDIPIKNYGGMTMRTGSSTRGGICGGGGGGDA